MLSHAREWLWQGRALAEADALIAAETAEHRTRREACRSLYDAAEQLQSQGAHSQEALLVLHRRGIEVSQETQALPSFLPDAHSIVLRRLEAPQRARAQAWSHRLYRLSGLLVAAAAAAAVAVPSFARLNPHPNLLADKPWKLSTNPGACKPLEHSCAGVTTDIFFHTAYEASPWIEYDLGVPTTFSKLYVRNRQDSLPERAVPLVAESSDDEKTWKLLVRREATFSEWSVGFPAVTARYFRLRVEKPTWFHLERVELK